MNNTAMKITLPFFILIGVAGCGMFEGIGEDLGGGLARGAVDSLATAERVEKLERAIDSLISATAAAMKRETPLVLDTLQIRRRVEEVTDILMRDLARARDDFVGPKTQEPLLALRDSLLGPATNVAIRSLLDSAVASAFGERTADYVGALRDELLGPATNSAVRGIVDSAMVSLIQRYRQDLQPTLRGDLGFIKNNAQELLITLGALTVVIVGYVWWQRTRYKKTVAILAQQINEIPDQGMYDNLTLGVRRNAQSAGVEPLLRKTLSEHGLLGIESWRPPKKQASTT